jgi:hypothetical protein
MRTFFVCILNKSSIRINCVSSSYEEDIAIFRFANGAWNELETTFDSEDATNYYYKAKLTGFSYFAIGEKAANVYSVTADLTIKGKTEPVKFELNVAGTTATAALKVNRTKYDIKYGSGSFFSDLGDKTISDDFDLNVKLAF